MKCEQKGSERPSVRATYCLHVLAQQYLAMESATQASLPADASSDAVRSGSVYSAAEIEAERFRAMAQMARAMGHSARNAMQSGHACLQILGFKLADRPDLIEMLDRVQTSQDRLLAIFNELNEYCATPQLQLEACQMSELMQSAVRLARDARPGNDVDIQISAIESRQTLRIDPKLMQRGLMRLLLDAMDAGASTIVARQIPSGAESVGNVSVEISDNRPRFGEIEAQKYFEPFAGRADNLGAAFAKRVVELHGCQMSVDGASQHGAKITFTLPRM